MPKIKDISNQKFGKLTAIEFSHISKNRAYWKCVCDCGNSSVIKLSNTLLMGEVQSCGCNTFPKRNKSRSWQGYEGLSKDDFSIVLRNAKNRGIEFDITIKDMWDRLIEQSFLCVLSGCKLRLKDKCNDVSYNASLDRINSEIGYKSNNIQWIDKRLQDMKWELLNEEFINHCKDIYNYKILHKPNMVDLHGPFEISDYYFNQFKNQAKQRNKLLDLNKSDIYDLYNKQAGQCVYSGRELIAFSDKRKWINNTLSVDRIDSSIGYFRSNIQLITKKINKMKNSLIENEFLHWVKLIAEYNGEIC